MVRLPVSLHRFGTIAYEPAWQWQRDAADRLRAGDGGECLALLEHPPVFTLGRRTRPEHLLFDRQSLASEGAEVVEVDRGGDVTFHGPGQLVGYPILHLGNRRLGPVDYVRRLEETLIRALAQFDIVGERVPGRPGVWAAGGKIAALGVRVQGQVTTHGFALNVEPDLGWFDLIVPCGLRDVSVTSMARILGAAPPVTDVAAAVADAFANVFESAIELAAPTPEFGGGASPFAGDWNVSRTVHGL